ncbi:helix-turn-helix domain-containing protein [Massilibacteroides sp.]|uniref:helix-turn-helix domain-containing protein n=1 Tax=Massilibacteroides sp. TaxID=2034766 RepID=UPI00261D9CB4|nr:helix-turn-helix domain-containing protein [Massilibacteroides sp.]MDD4514972.1 helix-turn-helix domain-containing protein [Massilibacteroides sp.]
MSNKEIKIIETSVFKILKNKEAREYIRVNQPFKSLEMYIALIKGKATIKVNEKTEIAGDSSILLLWKYPTIEITDLAEDAELRLILIPTEMILQQEFFLDYTFVYSMYKRPCFLTNKKMINEFIRFYDFIATQQTVSNAVDQDQLNKQLSYALFLKLKSLYISQDLMVTPDYNSEENTLADKFQILLFQEMWNEPELSFYANKLQVSSEELTAAIEKEWGDTAQNWILILRTNQIILSLRQNSLSLENIAQKFSFQSVADLETEFRKQTGKEVSAFRAQS